MMSSQTGGDPMTYYKDYQLQLLDRLDLKYSVYIAGLDIQYSCDLPYLWTFCFDCTGEVIYGRTWEDLRQFFRLLEEDGKFGYDHKLLVYVNDLTEFFTYARTQIDIDPEPFLAKSPSEILLFTSKGLEFRSFEKYTEKDIDKYIMVNTPSIQHIKPDPEGLSAKVKLTQDELNYSGLRVLEMTKVIRLDLDMIYQGITRNIKLTKTRRIELILQDKRRQEDRDNKLYWQIHKMNPLSSDFGLNVLLPQLRKAFYGGTVFYEHGVLNELLHDVYSADLTSAYCAEFICSKFPVNKFRRMTVPEDYKDILSKPYYTSRALLIQFEVQDVIIKKDGLAIIPAAMKHYYINKDSAEERRDAIKRAQGLKLRRSKIVRMCLTDIDFKLFCQYYDFDATSMKILSVTGANYGYLPDYIIKTVAELYHSKMISKQNLKKLEAAGIVDELQDELYKDEKSSIARLYGIFTQSPVVAKYAFDTDKKNLKIVNPEYLVMDNQWRPVVYQWGVWTTARVREKLCRLRDKLKAGKIKVVSGDTDCINFCDTRWESDSIISEFNDRIKSIIIARCHAIGMDPTRLQGIGELEVKKYKLYRLTGAKQYAVVRESEAGDVFEAKCGGLNKNCHYFQEYDPDPVKQIEHFRLGLTIPADAAPRIITKQISSKKKIDFIDREGHRIQDEISSYQAQEQLRFRLCDPFTPLLSNDIKGIVDKSALPSEVLASTAEHISKINTATPKKPLF